MSRLIIKSMLECFASLHAHIYTLEDDSWKSAFRLLREQFEKTLEAVPRDMLPMLESQGGERMTAALRKIPDASCVKSPSFGAHVFENSARVIGLPGVLVHGDVWSHNILWQPDDSGMVASDRLCALIDWQLCRYGAPTEDIAYLLSIGVSGDYRRKNTDSLLAFYHKRLTDKLSAKAKPVPFSLDELRAGYKKTLQLAVLFASFGVPLFISTGVETTESGKQFLLDATIDLIEDAYGSAA